MGAVLMVACAVCLAGIGISGTSHSEWLSGPALVFFGMGVYQFSRGREDDPIDFGPRPDPEVKRRPREE